MLDEDGIYSEQRQHLNLSYYAYGIMESDILMFRPSMKPSTFVNHIIKNSYEQSDASIERACEGYRGKLIEDAQQAMTRKSMHGRRRSRSLQAPLIGPNDVQMELIDYLVDEHRQKLLHKVQSYPKGQSFKVRLQNEVYRMLYRDDGDCASELTNYGGSQGRYIKALIECYARLSQLEREAVFFKEVHDDLSTECERDRKDRCLLKVTMAPGPKTGKSSVYYMKPHKVMSDFGTNYHYLVGVSRPAQQDNGKAEGYAPASIRLSRIKSFMRMSHSTGSGKITDAELHELEKKIKERGVPYLLSEIAEQRVRLTPEGINLFKQILHMRPNPERKLTETHENGDVTLTFRATERQISNYFKSFGANALILEPVSLAQEFKAHYVAAAAAYAGVPDPSVESDEEGGV